MVSYRVRSKKLLEPAMATDWSITHSPTPRYLLIHFVISLFSPATLSVLKLSLDRLLAVSACASATMVGNLEYSRQASRALHACQESRHCVRR